MLSRGKIGPISFILFAFGILTLSTAPASADREAASRPQTVSGDRLTKQQFEALPDSALIDFKGRRMTKASIRAREAQSRETAEKAEALARQSRMEFQQQLIQFDQQRKTKLEVDKAKAMGEFARLRQADSRQLKAIEVEAAQLQELSKRASPAEKAHIEQRASQLLQQLQGLEHR
jgi:flagellum-specific peptidoglycan hydrolase FlgJ